MSFGPEAIGIYFTNIASNLTKFNHLFSHFLFGQHFYVSQSFCDAVISAVSLDSPALKYTHTQHQPLQWNKMLRSMYWSYSLIFCFTWFHNLPS